MPYPAQIEPAEIGAVALAVVEKSGWDSWSLREVAAALSVTPNALYRHVDGRSGLHTAIAAAAASALRARLEAEPVQPTGIDDVVALSLAYLDFAHQRPNAYQAFMTAKPAPSDPAADEWFAIWKMLVGRVGTIAPHAADALCFALWAYLHGRAELARTAARFAPFDAGVSDAVQALAEGFVRRGPSDSPIPVEIHHLLGLARTPRPED